MTKACIADLDVGQGQEAPAPLSHPVLGTPRDQDRFVRMYGPLLDVLREMGGEGTPREICRRVADLVLAGTPERTREIK